MFFFFFPMSNKISNNQILQKIHAAHHLEIKVGNVSMMEKSCTYMGNTNSIMLLPT